MRRILAVLCLLAWPALAANFRLYLKDGGYHMVREYQVVEDRVRYYSVERGDWEEIPLAMVDVARTEKEIADRKSAREEDAKALAAEESFERELVREISQIPRNPGVYQLEGKQLRTFKPAESTVHTSKGRSVLRMMAPLPITGKGTLEIDGAASPNRVTSDRPEFYIQLSAEQHFGILRLTTQKGIRIVEKLTFVPVVKETEEEPDEVDIFRQQMDQNLLYKIWPVKPLTPGEYAVVEFTPGKMNMQIWDFACRPAGK